MTEKLSVVGQRVPRWAAYDKATGTARFLADIKLPGMLVGKILVSPHAHANILKIDTSKAKKLPGVRAVITADDTPGIKFSFLKSMADKLPLCKDKVRYVGDEVAVTVVFEGGHLILELTVEGELYHVRDAVCVGIFRKQLVYV